MPNMGMVDTIARRMGIPDDCARRQWVKTVSGVRWGDFLRRGRVLVRSGSQHDSQKLAANMVSHRPCDEKLVRKCSQGHDLGRKSLAVLDGLMRVVNCRAMTEGDRAPGAAPLVAVIVITPSARYLTARHMMAAKQRM